MMPAGETNFDDVTFDLISVQYHSLKAGHYYGQYVRDAENAGQDEIAEFFKQVMQQDSATWAQKCHKFLAQLGGTDNTSPQEWTRGHSSAEKRYSIWSSEGTAKAQKKRSGASPVLVIECSLLPGMCAAVPVRPACSSPSIVSFSFPGDHEVDLGGFMPMTRHPPAGFELSDPRGEVRLG